MERFGEGLKPDGDCLVSRYSNENPKWGNYHPINSRYDWQDCSVQPVGAYCEEAWDCEQYKCVNKKCVASGMDWDEETYHWDERTWDERRKGSEGMRGSDAESEVGGTKKGACSAKDLSAGCVTFQTTSAFCYCKVPGISGKAERSVGWAGAVAGRSHDEGEGAVGMERFGEGLKPDGDCLVSRYSNENPKWGNYHPINSRYDWQDCSVQPVGAYCEEAWDCEQYKCVNKKCVASGMDWDEETYHWDERTWDERRKGSEGMRGSDAESAVGGTKKGECNAEDISAGCIFFPARQSWGKTTSAFCYCPTPGTSGRSSVAVVTQPHSATSYAVNGLALLGLGALLYGAGAHYFKKEGAHVEF